MQTFPSISLLKGKSAFGSMDASHAINGFRLQTKYYCSLMLTLKFQVLHIGRRLINFYIKSVHIYFMGKVN